MKALLLCTCLLLGQEREKVRVPEAGEVAAAVAALEEAFRSDDPVQIEAALVSSWKVPHGAVLRALEAGFEDERKAVRLAVLQALRWNEHPDALERLHATTKEKKWLKDPELAAALLRGIGHHAEPRSIPFLARNPFDPDDFGCRRARIFGLAKIRTLDALEALMGILSVLRADLRSGMRRIQPQMDDVRLALMRLTGVDQGLSPEQWESWWRKNRRTFRIPEAVPELPKEMRSIWDRYWGNPLQYEREPRREDRGG